VKKTDVYSNILSIHNKICGTHMSVKLTMSWRVTTDTVKRRFGPESCSSSQYHQGRKRPSIPRSCRCLNLDRTSPDYHDYLSTWVEYKNFYDELSFLTHYVQQGKVVSREREVERV
jgi:hypothetical protein